jgi:hypothetical protein
VWNLAEGLIENRPEAYLIVDDSVQEKRHSQRIDLVKRQYSGNTHGLMKGIGIVNLVHQVGAEYYPIDFRVYAPQADGLTKNEHFRDLLRRAYGEKGIQAETILFDSWYAAAENLKFIHRLGKVFVTVSNWIGRQSNFSRASKLSSKKSLSKCSFSRWSPVTATLTG